MLGFPSKMGGADNDGGETVPFLNNMVGPRVSNEEMNEETKLTPTIQKSWPVTQPQPSWDVFHLWSLGWKFSLPKVDGRCRFGRFPTLFFLVGNFLHPWRFFVILSFFSMLQAMWALRALFCSHYFSIPCDPLCAHQHTQLSGRDFLFSACVNGLLLFVFLEMFQIMADGSLSEGHLCVLLPH